MTDETSDINNLIDDIKSQSLFDSDKFIKVLQIVAKHEREIIKLKSKKK